MTTKRQFTPEHALIVGRDEVPQQLIDEGGIVVGTRGDEVALVCFVPGGEVAFSHYMEPRMADEIGDTLKLHAAKVRQASLPVDQTPRCSKCHWPLAASVAEGCTATSCSYRGRRP